MARVDGWQSLPATVGRRTYSVTFPGQILSGGNTQITGYDTKALCTISGWGASAISVGCYNPDGSGADARFLLQHTQNSQDRFLWGDQPSAASYAPSASYAANPGGSAPSVTRSGVGSYTASFPGQTLSGGTVKVSAYGSKSVCNVAGWGGSAINVTCYDRLGNPVDSRYTLLYSKRVS